MPGWILMSGFQTVSCAGMTELETARRPDSESAILLHVHGSGVKILRRLLMRLVRPAGELHRGPRLIRTMPTNLRKRPFRISARTLYAAICLLGAAGRGIAPCG